MEQIEKQALIAIQDLIKVPPAHVALLGGSFDPPHLGHVCLALSILSETAADEVWVLPCANHPHEKVLQPLHQRVHMCQLAFRHLKPRVKVFPIEKFLPPPSFTAQTLKVLMNLYPNTQFDWLIGSDLLDQLKTWQDASWLQTNARFSVVSRAGYPIPSQTNAFKIQGPFGMAIPNIASHHLRKALAQNVPAIQGLDKAVMGYIREKGLYQSKC